MKKLVDQALKDLELSPNDINYQMTKLWLEKMYIRGTLNGIEKVTELQSK